MLIKTDSQNELGSYWIILEQTLPVQESSCAQLQPPAVNPPRAKCESYLCGDSHAIERSRKHLVLDGQPWSKSATGRSMRLPMMISLQISDARDE